MFGQPRRAFASTRVARQRILASAPTRRYRDGPGLAIGQVSYEPSDSTAKRDVGVGTEPKGAGNH
jgi:hypothetical protein